VTRSKTARRAAVALMVAAAWWSYRRWQPAVTAWADDLAEALEHLRELGGDPLVMLDDIVQAYEGLLHARWTLGGPAPRVAAAVDLVAARIEDLHALRREQ
jgi:hypothetical protein